MAPFKKDKKKKNSKGPKGKKGRAKAKKENQWGMKINDDENNNQQRRRKGKSRILSQMIQQNDNMEIDHVNKKWNGNYAKNKSNNDNNNHDDSTSSNSSNSSSCDGINELINDNINSSTTYKNLLNRIVVAQQEEDEGHDNNNDDDDSSSTSSSYSSSVDDNDDDNDNDSNDIEKNINEDTELENNFKEDNNNKIMVKERMTIDSDKEAKEDNNDESIFSNHFIKNTIGYKEDELDTFKKLHGQHNLKQMNAKKTNNNIKVHCSFNCSVYTKLLKCLDKNDHDTFLNNDKDKIITKQNWMNLNNTTTSNTVLTPLQSLLHDSLSSYSDILCTIETHNNRNEIYNIILHHLLNHILSSNCIINNNTSKINAYREMQEQKLEEENKKKKNKLQRVVYNKDDDNDDDITMNCRDQGYTKPKVLVLLPTRGTCHIFVSKLLKCLGYNNSSTTNDTSINIRNIDRFHEEFGPDDDDDNMKQTKGKDWNYFFGDTINHDDDFRIGISIQPPSSTTTTDDAVTDKTNKKKKKKSKHNKTSVQLYADFYRSDLIIASPLSMKMTTTSTSTTTDNETTADTSNTVTNQDDCDFLSSIDICLACHSDILLMQNWDHVNTTIDAINQLPKGNNTNTNTATDFSRVRDYFLAGQGSYWKQFIMISKFNDPNILSTFKRNANSINGEVRVTKHISTNISSISNIVSSSSSMNNNNHNIPQVFQKISCTSIQTQTTNRIDYFIKKILPPILRMQQKHTLLFIPSYFDYISIRNAMIQIQNNTYSTVANFVSLTEYSRVSEINRGRSRFYKGYKNIMLYTGRAHFFKRYRIRGVKHIIFFGIPEYSEFYTDIVNWVVQDYNYNNTKNNNDDDENIIDSPPSCLTLYTKYDAHALERIVGTNHCQRMITGDKNTFLFS